jgi:hypothetical protein
MKEQAPSVGDLGGESEAAELWLQQDHESLDALADEFGYGARVEIDQIDSDRQSYRQDLQDLTSSIDELLRMFAIDPSRWQERALKLRFSNRYPQIYHKEAIQQMAQDRNLGEILHDWSSSNLRIEDEEDGDGEVALTLALTDTLMVTFNGEGQHWSGHHYRDPDDPTKVLSGGWHDKRIRALDDAGYTMAKLEVEYEVAYSLSYSANFSRPSQES